MFRFGKRSKERRKGVDQRLIEISDLAIQITIIDFGIPEHGGVRSAPVQNKLYNDEKSKCDGYEEISSHQEAKALDVFAFVDGKASWDNYHLSMVACAMLQAASILGYKLEWGGLWPWDKPHFQLVD